MDKETKEKDVDTIEVSKSQLDAILERQTALEKDNEILKASVSKQKQDMAKSELDKKDAKYSATLKVWEDTPVIGWYSVEQKLERSPITGQEVGERIQSKYILADGREVGPFEMYKGQMSTNNKFTVVYKANKYPVIKDFKGYDGREYSEEEMWQIEWDNPLFAEKYGEVKEIPVRFLNDK